MHNVSESSLTNTYMQSLAGAAGFEPAITGSKPDALPLGYAPISLSVGTISRVRSRIASRHTDKDQSKLR
jgi:hypothetical protein